jgi:hypothetical protein
MHLSGTGNGAALFNEITQKQTNQLTYGDKKCMQKFKRDYPNLIC